MLDKARHNLLLGWFSTLGITNYWLWISIAGSVMPEDGHPPDSKQLLASQDSIDQNPEH